MSSPPLRVFLTKNEEETLFELSRANIVPQRTLIQSFSLLDYHLWDGKLNKYQCI